MSIKVSSFVWDNSKASEGSLLVLLAIADFSHDDGTGAWPSLQTLGKKARLSERGVRYAIRKLEDAGELVVDYKAGRNGCNRYRIVLTDPANIAGGSPLPGERAQDPEASFHEPGSPLPGDPEASCPQTVSTSGEPSELLTPPSSADEVVEAEFIDEKPRTAQTLVGRWIDSRDEKPVGRVVGQVSKLLKEMLDEGIAYERVELGLIEWSRSGYAASALPSFVDNAGKTPRRNNRQQDTNDIHERAFARAQAGVNVFATTSQKELSA